MNKDFQDFTISDATAAIVEAKKAADPMMAMANRSPSALRRSFEIGREIFSGVDSNRLFFHGDHWQRGEGWAGPRPSMRDENYQSVMAEIETTFVSKNAIKEVVRRHRNAVIGQEPEWRLALTRPLKDGESPTAAESALIKEAEAILVDWWDRRGVHAIFQDAVDTLLWAGRAYLRIFIPPGRLENGAVARRPIEEALDVVWVDQPDIDQAAKAVNDDTKAEAGVYLYQDSDGDEGGEISYLDKEGNTVVRSLGVQAGEQEESKVPAVAMPLRGKLLLHEMRREMLITPQVREHQCMINMALTMLARNVVLGGFLERVILNAQLPGKYETDPDDPKRQRFVPDKLHVGAGTTNALVGVPTYDETGRVSGYTSPSVIYRDPVATTTFESTRSVGYNGILEETDQLYTSISGDAAASGESRIQARAQFELSLKSTRTQVDAAGRWLLESMLALAALFSGQAKRYEGLRVDFSAQVNTGPQSAADVDMVLKKKGAGLISLETAQMDAKVEDPEAERQKMLAETEEGMARQLELMKKYPPPEAPLPAPAPALKTGGANGG
jgi:hypothetical protein